MGSRKRETKPEVVCCLDLRSVATALASVDPPCSYTYPALINPEYPIVRIGFSTILINAHCHDPLEALASWRHRGFLDAL